MILAVDIGNTSTTVGLFEDDKLQKRWTMASDAARSEDEYGVLLSGFLTLSGYGGKVKGAIISSVVVELTSRFNQAIEKYFNISPLVLNSQCDPGVLLKVDEPKQVGADRIANSYAAACLYKPPVIVVDFGTATTFDIVNKDKAFIGGIITPGLKIQASSLSKFTSKLPKVTITAPKNVIGKNSIDAMLSGLVRGHAGMIEELLGKCEDELGGKVTTVATGGYSELLGNYMTRKFDYINPDLTLEGLNLLYKLNSSNI